MLGVVRQQAQTYAVTAVCAERMRIFQRASNAELFIETVFRYRDGGRFLLHGFTVMPDHVHVMLSPSASLEQVIGLIKGGFSFAVRKQYTGPVWQDGYYAHRVVDRTDFVGQVEYVARNPERKGWCEYPFVHTRYADRLDPMPSHLGG